MIRKGDQALIWIVTVNNDVTRTHLRKRILALVQILVEAGLSRLLRICDYVDLGERGGDQARHLKSATIKDIGEKRIMIGRD